MIEDLKIAITKEIKLIQKEMLTRVTQNFIKRMWECYTKPSFPASALVFGKTTNKSKYEQLPTQKLKGLPRF